MEGYRAKDIKIAFENAEKFQNVPKYRRKKFSLWQCLRCTHAYEELNQTQILLRRVELAYYKYGFNGNLSGVKEMREYADLYQ